MSQALPPKLIDAKIEFERKFRELRNALKSIKRDDFLLGLIKALRENESIPPEEYTKGKPLPWTMLTLLRLACEFCGQNAGAKKAGNKDFIKIYNHVYELQDIYGAALLQDNISAYFFSLAHQQFWHQVKLHPGVVARLNYFYCSTQAEQRLNPWFKATYKLDISVFSELLIATWAIVATKYQLMYEINRSLAQANYDAMDIAYFLSLFSTDITEVDSFIQTRVGRIRDVFLQFGERTPFVLSPLLRINSDDYVPISLKLIERSGDMLAYELVKASNNDGVKKFFDDTFERYVGDLLDSAGLDPWRACDLENLFSAKTTDFIISCADKTIFVEAKSIRLGNLPIACPTSVHIPNDLHNTVIKAMEQGFEFGAALYDKCLTPNFFLVVVTYDDLYLGPPEAAWDRYFSKYFTPSKYGFDVTGIIDPAKIFIVGIREFEILCSSCNSLQSISRLFDLAVANNSSPGSQKHNFAQHIQNPVSITNNPLILEHYDAFFERLKAKLPA